MRKMSKLFVFFFCCAVVVNCSPKNEKCKVLIANPSVPQAGLDILEKKCDLIKINNESKAEILSKVKGVDAIFYATYIPLDKEILDQAGSQLKTVSLMSAGYNHINIPELKERGIKLSNTPKVLSDAVAEVAVLLTLGAARRSHEGRKKIESGDWKSDPQWLLGQDISGSTVGIIGLGSIGQAILKRLKPFGVEQFIYTGHKEKTEGKELGAKFVDFETLNKNSDFIIVSAPLTNETRGIINDDFFSKTKKTAVLVNIARGEIVNQEALIKALKEGKIFSAGLDVMTPEPLPVDHELLKLPNLVLTPHIGSATVKTRNSMSVLAAKNILKGIEGEELLTPVF
ncbi:unnamed protein product [Brassicogethes aeneus]|uniref:Glyoxylate reductase/hydroxypyruvate reductase n=1 Tax=Brassicogethes aeneus TaxID=1431903 RepID=A0A9P0FS01_BRAAE|nr:unnamed protein product [Brassicogethes aeneus]